MRRLDGLDRLRAAALLMMLVHHLTGWFATSDARDILPGWPAFAITDVAAPAFTVAVGASVVLLTDRLRASGSSLVETAATVVRRYGLLVPTGIALRSAMGFDLGHVGVLEILGLSAVVTAGIVLAAGPLVSAAAAIALLVVSPVLEHAVHGQGGLPGLLGNTFPLAAYAGLALVGATGVRLLRGRDRPVAALAAGAVLGAATVLRILDHHAPARYPAGVDFLLPGLAGTLFLYALVASRPVARCSGVARGLSVSGRHTLGVFVGHYAVFWLLGRTGHLHELGAGTAVLAAVAVTAAVVGVAPHVPQLPWSPRTGWRRGSPVSAGGSPPRWPAADPVA